MANGISHVYRRACLAGFRNFASSQRSAASLSLAYFRFSFSLRLCLLYFLFFDQLLILPPLVEDLEEVFVAQGARFVQEPFLPLYSHLVLLCSRTLLGLHTVLFFLELLQGLLVLRLCGLT